MTMACPALWENTMTTPTPMAAMDKAPEVVVTEVKVAFGETGTTTSTIDGNIFVLSYNIDGMEFTRDEWTPFLK